MRDTTELALRKNNGSLRLMTALVALTSRVVGLRAPGAAEGAGSKEDQAVGTRVGLQRLRLDFSLRGWTIDSRGFTPCSFMVRGKETYDITIADRAWASEFAGRSGF